MKGPLRLHLPSAAMRLSMPTKRLRMSLDGRVINAGPAKYLTLEQLTATAGTQVGQLRELVALVGGVPVHVGWYEWDGAAWVGPLEVAGGGPETLSGLFASAGEAGDLASVKASDGTVLALAEHDGAGWTLRSATLAHAEAPARLDTFWRVQAGLPTWDASGLTLAPGDCVDFLRPVDGPLITNAFGRQYVANSRLFTNTYFIAESVLTDVFDNWNPWSVYLQLVLWNASAYVGGTCYGACYGTTYEYINSAARHALSYGSFFDGNASPPSTVPPSLWSLGSLGSVGVHPWQAPYQLTHAANLIRGSLAGGSSNGTITSMFLGRLGNAANEKGRTAAVGTTAYYGPQWFTARMADNAVNKRPNARWTIKSLRFEGKPDNWV